MKILPFIILISFSLVIVTNFYTINDLITKSFYAHIDKLIDTKIPLEKHFILDSLGVILGIRKLVSDIAWIQLLQYYGGEPPEEDSCHTHNCLEHMTKIQPGKYLDLIKYCRRVIILDPLYSYVYFFGVGSLAWNLERTDEALEFIKDGLKNLEYQKNDPESDYWQLVRYQQAIYYKIGGKYKDMINELSIIVRNGKAPDMVKAILANLYKKFGYYEEAIKIWYELLYSQDPEYVERAKEQIFKIKKLLKQKK